MMEAEAEAFIMLIVIAVVASTTMTDAVIMEVVEVVANLIFL